MRSLAKRPTTSSSQGALLSQAIGSVSAASLQLHHRLAAGRGQRHRSSRGQGIHSHGPAGRDDPCARLAWAVRDRRNPVADSPDRLGRRAIRTRAALSRTRHRCAIRRTPPATAVGYDKAPAHPSRVNIGPSVLRVSSSLTDAWVSDNPRAAVRIQELCGGRRFGAELIADELAAELDPPAERGSMLVRLSDNRVYVVAPDDSRREDPARLLGTYQPKATDPPWPPTG
jgi:hypothetical protein